MTALSDRTIYAEMISGGYDRRNYLVHHGLMNSRFVRHAIAPDRVFGDGMGNVASVDELANDNIFVIEPVPLPEQVHASVLELRVGNEVFLMKGDFTSLHPSLIEEYADEKFVLKKKEAFIAEPGKVYMVKSLERLRLPKEYYGVSDARSGLARVGCGACAATTKHGVLDGGVYTGEPEHVYMKIQPHAFPIVLRCGETRPMQVRFRENGSGPLSSGDIEHLYGKAFFLREKDAEIPFHPGALDENGLALRIDLKKGYYVQRNVKKPVDFMLKDAYDWEEFFEFHENGDGVVLKPRKLYLFGSKEDVCLGKMVCGDLVRSPDALGHGISNNFARFFQPGFEGGITLEAWLYADNAWMLFDEQYFGRVLLELLDGKPLREYTGNFMHQRAPRLTGCFR